MHRSPTNNPLTADHAELDELLADIFRSFEDKDFERIYRQLDFFWARLAMHIRAEHLHLFPAILEASRLTGEIKEKQVPTFEVVKETIKRLQDDHNFFMRELAAAVKQTREVSDSDKSNLSPYVKNVRKIITSVRKRLEIHNELEETEVYGWADALVEKTELAALNTKLQREINNLPPRFQKK
jgi:hypothetical protein